jgi:hypothetical protein
MPMVSATATATARSYSVWRACQLFNSPLAITTLASTPTDIAYTNQRYGSMWSWLQQRLADNDCTLNVTTIASPSSAIAAADTCNRNDDIWLSDAATYEWRLKSAPHSCTTRSLLSLVESASSMSIPAETSSGLLLRLNTTIITKAHDYGLANVTSIPDIPIWLSSMNGEAMMSICAVSNSSLVGYLAQVALIIHYS